MIILQFIDFNYFILSFLFFILFIILLLVKIIIIIFNLLLSIGSHMDNCRKCLVNVFL